jgi:RNA polymerase sigma factor (sigma-70 family)
MTAEPLVLVLRRLRRLAGAPDAEATDRELLEQFVTRRDEEAFAALVGRHGPMVLGVCRRLLAHSQDAEDAFQATFLILARKAASVRDGQALAAWLHEVARHVAGRARAAAVRRRSRERQVREMTQTNPIDAVAQAELRAVLDEELAGLPAKYRVPLVLCDLEGRTHEAAAQEIGCPPGSVSWRLSRARALLRERLVRRGVTLGAGALLAGEGAAAPLPPALLQTTTRAAVRFAAGCSSGAAAALAAATLRTLGGGTRRLLAGLLLAVVAAGAGALLGDRPAKGGDADEPKPAGPTPAAVRTDRHGDPLPPGALSRAGTLRFRHAEGVTCSAFSPDGKTLISSSHDGTLRLWDVLTGKERRRFLCQEGGVRRLALSPNGALLASWGGLLEAHGRHLLAVWDVRTGKRLASFVLGDDLPCLAWSPDSKILAAPGSDEGTVRLWDVTEGKALRTLHWPKVAAVAFSPDGKRLAACGTDGTIRVGSVAGDDEPLLVRGKEKEFHFVAFSPDGKTLITGGDCYGDDVGPKTASVNTIAVWDAASGKRLRDFRVGDDRDQKAVTSDGSASVALSADGTTLALGYWDFTVRLWDVGTGKPLRKLTGYPDRFYPAYHLAFSPDGRVVAAAGSYHTVCLLDTVTGKALNDTDTAQQSDIRSVALSPGGKVLATASNDRTVCLWEAGTGRPLRELRGHEGAVYAVALSPDGRTVASGGTDGTVRLWDAATGREVGKLAVSKEPPVLGLAELYVSCVAFSPDGKLLASSHDQGGLGRRPDGEDGIRLWDVATSKELRRLKAPSLLHGGALCFSADGKALIAAGDDHTVRRWRVVTGEEVSRFVMTGQQSGGSVALSRDGALAAYSGDDGQVTVWDVSMSTEGRQAGSTKGQQAGDELLLAIPTPKRTVYRPVFSTDNRYLALCSVSYGPPVTKDRLHIELWELASGATVRWLELPQHGGVSSAAFADRGLRLATGLADTTALVWDLAPAGEAGSPEDAWRALAAADAGRAYQAMGTLLAAPEKAVTFLEKRLRPTADLDPEPILRLVKDLDSDEFAVRAQAFKELERLGPEAEPLFRRLLTENPSAEVRKRLESLLARPRLPLRSPESLRRLRAVAVLEWIDSAESRAVLKRLARGAEAAPQTREAREALARMVGQD